jgi:hypothetical protein
MQLSIVIGAKLRSLRFIVIAGREVPVQPTEVSVMTMVARERPCIGELGHRGAYQNRHKSIDGVVP